MPALHLAEAQVADGGRAYVYELNWPALAHARSWVPASLDVALLFGTFEGSGPAGP